MARMSIHTEPIFIFFYVTCKHHFRALKIYLFIFISLLYLGTLAKYTGGQVYYYPGFQSSIHGEKLKHDLARDLTRETAWEAVMRIRCGKGDLFLLNLFLRECSSSSLLTL